MFLLALVLHLPAANMFAWTGLSQTVAMQGVSGSVWSGSASAASVALTGNQQGREATSLYLGRVRWRFQPISLLVGRLEYLVEADGPTIAGLRGHVSRAGDGVRLVDTRGRARIEAVAPLLSVPMLGGLTGTVDFNLEHVVLATGANAGWPQRADGRLQLRTIGVPLLGSDPLGDFDVVFRSEGEDVQVEYKDLATGPLALEGTAALHADGSVERTCTASARAGAQTMLAQTAPLICSDQFF